MGNLEGVVVRPIVTWETMEKHFEVVTGLNLHIRDLFVDNVSRRGALNSPGPALRQLQPAVNANFNLAWRRKPPRPRVTPTSTRRKRQFQPGVAPQTAPPPRYANFNLP